MTGNHDNEYPLAEQYEKSLMHLIGRREELRCEQDLIKNELKQVMETLRDTASQASSLMPKERRQILAEYLYWNEDLPDAVVGMILGVPGTKVSQKIPPQSTGYMCSKHEHPLVYANKKDRSKQKFSPCPICQEERSRQVDKEYQEHKAQLAEYESWLKNLPYQEYLQTDHWNEMRKQALRRAKYKCQLCSDRDEVHVHHNSYDNLGQERTDDLVVLCKNCHARFHGKEAVSA